MILYNKTKNIVVSDKLKIANNFINRFLGLIPKKKLEESECLMITNCPAVHSCFMRFTIDVVFVSKENKVLDIVRMKPWRFSKFYDSKYAIEFNSGFVYGKISIGDEVEVK
ncbi:MAG: DUF192 domain-containing protein [Elusimicrobiota bacterium]